jgi:hypothetical protein
VAYEAWDSAVLCARALPLTRSAHPPISGRVATKAAITERVVDVMILNFDAEQFCSRARSVYTSSRARSCSRTTRTRKGASQRCSVTCTHKGDDESLTRTKVGGILNCGVVRSRADSGRPAPGRLRTGGGEWRFEI